MSTDYGRQVTHSTRLLFTICRVGQQMRNSCPRTGLSVLYVVFVVAQVVTTDSSNQSIAGNWEHAQFTRDSGVSVCPQISHRSIQSPVMISLSLVRCLASRLGGRTTINSQRTLNRRTQPCYVTNLKFLDLAVLYAVNYTNCHQPSLKVPVAVTWVAG